MEVQRYLEKFSQQGLDRAKRFVEIISGTLLCFKHIECLLQQGSTCSYWTLAYAEVEICQRIEGPASRPFPSELVKAWKARVKGFWLQLKAEETKQLQCKEDVEKKEAKRRVEQEKKLQKAEDDLKKLKDFSSLAAKKASESLVKNSKYFTVANLSEDAKLEILKASGGIGVCSKCWWSYGCLKCTPAKALSYWLRKEAAAADKVPKWEGLCFS